MNALYLVITALAAGAIGYRFYSAFIAAKVMVLDDSRRTPAHTKSDGSNYYPTQKWVLFGHHFAAIAGAGPLVGPVFAVQFGWAPGFMWLLAGCVLAGAVHDAITLWVSTRRGGRSLAEIARTEIGPVAGVTAIIAVLSILIVALAGLGLIVVNALADSAWGMFTIGVTIPIAVFMGFYMFRWRKGKVKEATFIGVSLLLAGVVFGKTFAESSIGHYLVLSAHQITAAMGIYAFIAAVIPVWMLLTPRSYLSTYMKIGVMALLAIGTIVAAPTLRAPAFSQFIGGGGPIQSGPLFPFVFITIACGAISGFHALISSGTTSKMVDKETDIRAIGYMGMLFEGLVGVMALIAAASLHPGDYYAINVAPAAFAKLGIPPVDVYTLQDLVHEHVIGRTGGAVSLALGMAQIFSSLPGFRNLVDYWYHFAIMFEALFILTTVDSGTRVGRFLLQETFGRVSPKFADQNWMPGAMICSGMMVVVWGYFIWTGNVGTIWPLFGVGNQLLASVALAVGSTMLINMGRARVAWVTIAPLCFISVTTLTAGVMTIRDTFWPLTKSPVVAIYVQGYVDSIAMTIMLTCSVILLVASVRRWVMVLSGRLATTVELSQA
jgi:carbon starvation protein